MRAKINVLRNYWEPIGAGSWSTNNNACLFLSRSERPNVLSISIVSHFDRLLYISPFTKSQCTLTNGFDCWLLKLLTHQTEF